MVVTGGQQTVNRGAQRGLEMEMEGNWEGTEYVQRGMERNHLVRKKANNEEDWRRKERE